MYYLLQLNVISSLNEEKDKRDLFEITVESEDIGSYIPMKELELIAILQASDITIDSIIIDKSKFKTLYLNIGTQSINKFFDNTYQKYISTIEVQKTVIPTSVEF